jgi:hypothetical protein
MRNLGFPGYAKTQIPRFARMTTAERLRVLLAGVVLGINVVEL